MPRFRVFLTDQCPTAVELLQFLGDIPDAELDEFVYKRQPDRSPDLQFPIRATAVAVITVPPLKAALLNRLATASPLICACEPQV